MLAVWRAADDIELFESGWTFDHFYPIFSDSTGPCLEGWTTLTALAQATTRLRLGVLVTGIHYRHPAVLANMAATLDIISGGRLELGIGAGWNEEESRRLRHRARHADASASTASTRRCEVHRRAAHARDDRLHGRYFQLTDARCEPKPMQRPHPPICIGGTGEKRTLRAVARFAQHWNFAGGRTRGVRPASSTCWHAHCADDRPRSRRDQLQPRVAVPRP